MSIYVIKTSEMKWSIVVSGTSKHTLWGCLTWTQNPSSCRDTHKYRHSDKRSYISYIEQGGTLRRRLSYFITSGFKVKYSSPIYSMGTMGL